MSRLDLSTDLDGADPIRKVNLRFDLLIGSLVVSRRRGMCQSSGGYEHRGESGEVEHSTGLPSLVWTIMSFRSLTCETGFEMANGDL
jgi:hypothetical protein